MSFPFIDILEIHNLHSFSLAENADLFINRSNNEKNLFISSWCHPTWIYRLNCMSFEMFTNLEQDAPFQRNHSQSIHERLRFNNQAFHVKFANHVVIITMHHQNPIISKHESQFLYSFLSGSLTLWSWHLAKETFERIHVRADANSTQIGLKSFERHFHLLSFIYWMILIDFRRSFQPAPN